jgi:hypothetical protein
VVTGLGVVSCLGHEHDEFYSNLLDGKSGIATIEGFDAAEYSTRIAGEIKVSQSVPSPPKRLTIPPPIMVITILILPHRAWTLLPTSSRSGSRGLTRSSSTSLSLGKRRSSTQG